MTKKRSSTPRLKLNKKSVRRVDPTDLERARGGTDAPPIRFTEGCGEGAPHASQATCTCTVKPGHLTGNHNQHIRVRS